MYVAHQLGRVPLFIATILYYRIQPNVLVYLCLRHISWASKFLGTVMVGAVAGSRCCVVGRNMHGCGQHFRTLNVYRQIFH